MFPFKNDIVTCGALCDLILCTHFKKREKHPWSSVTFSKVAGWALLRGCFSRLSNCTNSTKSRNAPHISQLTEWNKMAMVTYYSNHKNVINSIAYSDGQVKPFITNIHISYTVDRSSHRACSVTLLKIRVWRRRFPVKFSKFLRTTFLTRFKIGKREGQKCPLPVFPL